MYISYTKPPTIFLYTIQTRKTPDSGEESVPTIRHYFMTQKIQRNFLCAKNT